ncbi:MAG: hypothetical protein P4M15_12235, partial [Alphaproteobacteria bacterium]|nr:hypothetical protein [Alphaproteobacteria bacterium]
FSTSLISLTPHPENALASKPPPRYSPPTSNCCTSNVNPPPGLRRDDEGGETTRESVCGSRRGFEVLRGERVAELSKKLAVKDAAAEGSGDGGGDSDMPESRADIVPDAYSFHAQLS